MSDDRNVRIGGHEFDPALRAALVPDARDGSTPYIVQLHEERGGDTTNELRASHGVRFNDYVSGGAYVEKLDAVQFAGLASDSDVRAVVPFEPAFKLGPVQASAGGLRMVLFPDANPELVAARVQEMTGADVDVHDDRDLGGVAQLISAAALSDEESLSIAQLDGVRWMEPVPAMKHDDSNTAGMLQSGDRGAVPAWDHGLHGEQQVIGVIDGLLDHTHCWFRDATDNTPGPDHRKLAGLRDAAPGPQDEHRPSDHGTFVCGIVAGDDSHAAGKAPDRGLAWAARMTFGSSLDVPRRMSLLRYLTAAAADGARIHTNSWHEEPQPSVQYNQTAADVDAFVWNNEDNLVLGSAGNINESLGPPGTAKNALCVSACHGEEGEVRFGDGGTGPTLDLRPRYKPEIMAPGCQITSARSETTCLTKLWNTCASSWATPAAAAAAALVRQYYTEGWYPTGAREVQNAFIPSGALLKATLLNAAVDVARAADFPSNTRGWGSVQLSRVLGFGPGDRSIAVTDVRNRDGLRTGDRSDRGLTVGGQTRALILTLVWSDPPVCAGSADPMVNTLDLLVSSPAGNLVFHGNVFANGASTTGDAVDGANNVKMVIVDDPERGDWSVAVIGADVKVGDSGQGFALVVRTDRTAAP